MNIDEENKAKQFYIESGFIGVHTAKTASVEINYLDMLKLMHYYSLTQGQILPSIEMAGIIAVKISEINNEMTAQQQALFIAGFQECIKYLEMQSNER